MPSLETEFSQDEYDALPDDFDFSAVVEPPVHGMQPPINNIELDEYDMFNEMDTFADIDLDTIAALGPRSITGRVAQPPATDRLQEGDIHMPIQRALDSGGASTHSTQYSFDEMDAAFLDEVRDIERNAVRMEQSNRPLMEWHQNCGSLNFLDPGAQLIPSSQAPASQGLRELFAYETSNPLKSHALL